MCWFPPCLDFRIDRMLAHSVVLAVILFAGCATQSGPADETSNNDHVPREQFEAVRAELEMAQQEITELRLELAQARQRSERTDRNAERLRADIRDAEEALVALESGLKGMHTRADAVSALADARIVVTRAARQAPWREASILQAREKLAEAERHIEEEYFGSAVFFTVRGRRIAEEMLDLARQLREDPSVRFVRVNRANVREDASTDAPIVAVLKQGTPIHVRGEDSEWIQIVTPDDEVGWIYGNLLASEL